MIRRATAADLPAVVALTNAAYAAYDGLLDVPALPVTEDYTPRIAAGEVWLLAADDAPPVGGPEGVIVLETHADHLLIFSVAVAPDRQHGGVGQHLLAWAEQQARTLGRDRLRLYTNAKMTRNLALYARVGYLETGRRSNPHRPGWVAVDMEKRLDGAAA